MPFKPKNSRFYHFDFQVGGRRFYGSCKTENFEEAKTVEAGERVAAKKAITTAAANRFTVNEALGTYVSDICQHQPSAATSKSYARAVLKVLSGKTGLHELDNATLARTVAKMRATVADSTANRQIAVLARSVRHMQKIHDAEVSTRLDFKTTKLHEEEERIRELTADEEFRLFGALRPDLHPLVKFALMTGKRREEICSLKWSAIDYGTNRIRFRIKGGKTHRLPMNGDIRALLSAMPRSNVMEARRYVFTYLGVDADRRAIPPSGGHVWEMWRDALHEAEIEDFRFHDLRHTFASRLLRQCRNLKMVSKLLGHASIDSTMKYAHVLDDDLEAGMEAFSALSPELSPKANRKT